uniref:RING-type E3 ubiquitin transferase n=1 Tax=Timema monikensis TaxID=170555 RepID=A0A7R9EKX6_9NEOP|nr:unnamed protein product [Timema monikensis]
MTHTENIHLEELGNVHLTFRLDLYSVHNRCGSETCKYMATVTLSKVMEVSDPSYVLSMLPPLSSTGVVSINVQVLECRVCEDVFGLQGDKVPRLLYCGHTVCHACLLRLPLRDNVVQCPFDRQPTPTGNSGVWGLKKNFALLELLERLQNSQEKSTLFLTADSLEKERQLAVQCDENEVHIAVLYCTVCTSHLCEECSGLTHATRTLARHRRVPLSDKPREKPKCPSHPSHVAEFTCLEEDCQGLQTGPGPIMCFICKDYGRHKDHKVVQRLEGVSNSDVEELGAADMARGRVQNYFQQLRETLQLQEAAAMTTVDTHIRERLCSLRQLQDDLATSLSQVKRDTHLEQLLHLLYQVE